jgi:ankyrin repeat protein
VCQNKPEKEDIVVHLLSERANVHAKDSKGDTPLHLAARSANQGILDLLLRNNPHTDDSVSKKTSRQCSDDVPVRGAASNKTLGGPEDLKELSKPGLNGCNACRMLNARNMQKRLPIHEAVLSGDIRCIRALLNGYNPGDRKSIIADVISSLNLQEDAPKYSALLDALKDQFPLSIEAFLDHLPSPLSADPYDNILHLACRHGLGYLLMRVPDQPFRLLSKAKNKDQMKPFDVAVKSGNFDCAHLLMNRGYEPSLGNLKTIDEASKMSMLHYAVMINDADMVDFISKRCDREILLLRDGKNRTPLDLAIQKGLVKIIKVLQRPT